MVITEVRPPVQKEATLADLYQVEGKAELVGGKIIPFMATGRKPFYASFEIAVSLRLFVRKNKLPGLAIADNAGFVVNLLRRKSFSPDAGYYEGPNDSGMKFFEGAPLFAVEVRSENDYGPAAEVEMVSKRRDYFTAGTLVVWDVDLLGDTEIVRVFRDGRADIPAVVYKRGDLAEAEPAVPGWAIAVDDLFE